ncbi:hypothetical protein AAW01_10875 [Aurantiacibacter gangjinensis]|uniref:Uncharacterized protein n=2 Tax=Aurantiacibacter gangjinensis TaxID=502682 RepID=A0A0G9MRJ3_9SPHN|nr:hypothetical protein AAW01_10875 [Aurantiacibacter gangjinensis]
MLAVSAAFGALFCSGAVAAQDASDICEPDGACRYIENYVFEGRDGESFSVPVDAELPWVVEGNVLLTPGEAVTVRLIETDGALQPQLVRSGDEARNSELAEGEILFDLGPHEAGTITMTVKSAYPALLEYAALAVTLNSGPARTSVCVLMPGVMVIETWQDPIYQLAMWGFRPAEGHSCSVIDLDAEIAAGNASE